MKLSKNSFTARFSSGLGRTRTLLLVGGAALLTLAGCGFHLRGSAPLPPGMERVYVDSASNGEFQRKLVRALLVSGAKIEDHKGNGIAEMHVPSANFATQILTVNGGAQITEFAIRLRVVFSVTDAKNETILPPQTVDMQREFSYDASQPVGTQSQIDEIQTSLADDAVQAVLFRLQAVSEHGRAAAAKAVGPLPASASTSQQAMPEVMPKVQY